MCCRLKMKLEELWQRTSGCILKIRGVTPDGAGNFELEAGQNVKISEVSNGLRISTTGGVSYYTSDDPQLDIDNDDLKISLVDVAKDSDVQTLATGLTNLLNGGNVGTDVQPIKIVNGVATPVYYSLMPNYDDAISFINVNPALTVYQSYARKIGRGVQIFMYCVANSSIKDETLFSVTSAGKVRSIIPFAEQLISTNGDRCGLWSSNGADEFTHNFIIPNNVLMQAGTYYISLCYLTTY